MIATPTTTVSVYGSTATTTDDYDDQVVDDTPTAVGVPASILEQTRQATTSSSDMARTVRSATGRLPDGTDVAAGTRLLDEQTNTVWLVDSTSQNANPHLVNDIRCDLRRVD